MHRSCLLISPVAALLAGCASDLEIFAYENGVTRQVAGMPFHVPELYVREGVYKKASKGGACDEAPFVETEALPLGPLYYASIRPAQFAKTGFVMKFNDKGNVSEVTLNTEPSGEMLTSAGELIKAVTPILGAGAAGLAGAGARPACDTGPENVVYTRFSDWQATHR